MTTAINDPTLLLQRADIGDFPSAEESGSAADASVEALIEQADGLDRQYSCHPINGTAIVRVEPDRITIGDDNLQLMSGGWDALAKYCGAPSGYWGQIDPEFRSRIAQYHIDDGQILEPTNEDSGIEAIAFQRQFIGFRSARLVHLDFATVIRAVIEALGNDGQFYSVNRLNVTGDSISVELKTPRQTHAVQVGDVVQGGISLSHSFLGSHPTMVDLFIYRLQCQNGMSLRHCVGHSRISRSRRLKNLSDQSVAAAIEQVQRMVHWRSACKSDPLREKDRRVNRTHCIGQ